MKQEAGLSEVSSVVTLNVMKCLLSMTQFRLVSGGDNNIRAVQRKINKNYEEYNGIIPCDGVYGREMNTALIRVLQCIEGLPPIEATGNFGTYTTNNCPVISSVPPAGMSSSKYQEAVCLLKFALTCNGYYPGDLSGEWTDALVMHMSLFQQDIGLPQASTCNLDTWMALLLSSGNPNRDAIACDTSEIINETKAKALYNAGYRYIGRYLTGTVGTGEKERSKALTEEEIRIIFNAGLRLFVIFQTGAAYVGRYTYEKGVRDGLEAIEAADLLGVPYDEIIYFAVDYDLLGEEIDSNALPYFKGIRNSFLQHFGKYKIGVYGTRNTCSGFKEVEQHSNPVLSEPTEEALKERAIFLLKKLGMNLSANFSLSKKYVEKRVINGLNCEIEYGTVINIELSDTYNMGVEVINIKNGEMEVPVYEKIKDVIEIIDSGNMELKEIKLEGLLEISQEIRDGRIKIGIGVNPILKTVSIYYQIDEEYIINDTITTTLTTYWKITIQYDDTSVLQEFADAVNKMDVSAVSVENIRIILTFAGTVLLDILLLMFWGSMAVV